MTSYEKECVFIALYVGYRYLLDLERYVRLTYIFKPTNFNTNPRPNELAIGQKRATAYPP